MPDRVTQQARRLYGVFSELLRRYQFRDRDQICCHGLTVTQCYTMEALARRDSMTMGELAEHLCLKISSMTRVVDHLVAEGWVRRGDDPDDRRICRVQITHRGRLLVEKVQRGLLAEYEQVLRAVPAESREAVIAAVGHLLAAFEERQCCAADPQE